MNTENKFLRSVKSLDSLERVERAKKVIKELTYRIHDVIQLYASIEIVVYSDSLSSQIPPSYAAHAFNNFQSSLHNYLFIRLISIWDQAADNAVSIPTALALVDCPTVIEHLALELHRFHANSRAAKLGKAEEDPDFEIIFQETQDRFGKDSADKLRHELPKLISNGRSLMSGEILKRTRNLRDHLSHSLSETRRETNGPVDRAKFGDEKYILNASIPIIEGLYTYVNGVSFDISVESCEAASKRAIQLWGNCKFDLASE